MRTVVYFRALGVLYANRSWRARRVTNSDRRRLVPSRHQRVARQFHDWTDAVGGLWRDCHSGWSWTALDGEPPACREQSGTTDEIMVERTRSGRLIRKVYNPRRE
jgi:hypothetical protein